MRQALARIVRLSGLVAIACCAQVANSIAKEVHIPGQVVVTHWDDATVRWEARVPDIKKMVPELNAGDKVKS